MNTEIITEYVELHTRLVTQDAPAEQCVYARLERLWYAEMAAADRSEVKDPGHEEPRVARGSPHKRHEVTP